MAVADRQPLMRAGAAAGLAAGILVLCVAAAIRLSGGPPGPAEMVFDAVVLSTPGQVESLIISRLRHAAKPLLFVSSAAAVLAACAATGAVLGLLETVPRGGFDRSRLLVAALLPFTLGGVTLARVTGRPIDVHLTIIVVGAQLAYIAGALLWRLARARPPVHTGPQDLAPSGPVMTRRRALQTGAQLALVAAIGTSAALTAHGLWSKARRRVMYDVPAVALPAPGEGIFARPELAVLLEREVTPTRQFYRVSKNALDPEVARSGWRLSVEGLVQQPLVLTLDDLTRLERVERYHSLMCISIEIGDSLIGNAVWAGARLLDVLEAAKVSGDARFVNFTSADGYVESITMDEARGTLLAYNMNGAPLEDRHGFPLRALVPGTYGMKNPKWITRITVATTPEQGFWNKLGWDAGAPPKTFSRIDLPALRTVPPGDVVVAGVAFAGNRGISKVEISDDDGQTWQATQLRQALSPNAWVLWAAVWTPRGAGEYKLAVRATDGGGTTQPPDIRPPFPSGASGFHRITVTVKGAHP